MKLAIHHRPGSFSDRWITYCDKNNIPYKIVNVYNNDIIEQIKDCKILIWHHQQSISADIVMAKSLLNALHHAKTKIFPDFNTGWHFDDKIGQKYLLEAIGAPLVKTYVFYNKKKALEWAELTTFPKVFKLRGGAGSANVRLVKNQRDALQLINRAFGNGFRQYEPWTNLNERWRQYKEGLTDLKDVFKGVLRFLKEPDFSKTIGFERSYIYFQDFIPNNDSDTRVIVIGNRAFAVKRIVRKDDFRSSGSGSKKYDKNLMDERTISISFDLAKKLKSTTLACDFVFDERNNPFLLEISYGFAIEFYDPCPGYWDSELNWHEGKFIPQEWIIEDLISSKQKNEA